MYWVFSVMSHLYEPCNKIQRHYNEGKSSLKGKHKHSVFSYIIPNLRIFQKDPMSSTSLTLVSAYMMLDGLCDGLILYLYQLLTNTLQCII